MNYKYNIKITTDKNYVDNFVECIHEGDELFEFVKTIDKRKFEVINFLIMELEKINQYWINDNEEKVIDISNRWCSVKVYRYMEMEFITGWIKNH